MWWNETDAQCGGMKRTHNVRPYIFISRNEESKMEFYDVVDKRRTIRDFEDCSITDTVIERIINAGMKAPTNDHLRDWHFIIIKDKSVVIKLINHIPQEITENDIENVLRDWNLDDFCQQEAYKSAIPKQYRMLAEASAVIVPLFKQKVDLLHPDNLSHLNGFASIWCCIENIFLAATAEGYACTLRIPLGDEDEWSRKVLGYPDDYLMPCFIAIGKAKADAKFVKQKEYSLNDRIHKEMW